MVDDQTRARARWAARYGVDVPPAAASCGGTTSGRLDRAVAGTTGASREPGGHRPGEVLQRPVRWGPRTASAPATSSPSSRRDHSCERHPRHARPRGAARWSRASPGHRLRVAHAIGSTDEELVGVATYRARGAALRSRAKTRTGAGRRRPGGVDVGALGDANGDSRKSRPAGHERDVRFG